jgi:putative sigma-54 modulation protein
MKIRITHKNMEISRQVRELIEEKCNKLERFTPIVGEVGIVFKMEKNYRWLAEINVPVRGTVIHGEAKAEDLLSSFEEALDKVEIQAKKRRDKIIEHKNQNYDYYRTS